MQYIKRFFGEFKEFAVKGNMMDLAIGIIIGTAFNKVVQSLVTDIILPPIGLLLRNVEFSNLFVSLNGQRYETLKDAQAATAPTLNYGIFIDSLISFVITAFAVYLIVRWLNILRRRRESGKDIEPTQKPCPFCFSQIPVKATRCPHCTSTLP
jgi:large conductance mechanosensitive channel